MDECSKYDTLFLGAVKYCEEKIKRNDKALWQENVKAIVKIEANIHTYDRAKKCDILND